MSAKAKASLLSRVPPDFVRAVLKGHSALGLAFAAVLYLVCLTGTIAVFAHEFERWERSDLPSMERAVPEAVQRALVAAVAEAGEVEHAYIQMPDADLPHLVISADTHDGKQKSWAADANGGLVAEGAAPWTEFLTRLHINLHLPRSIGLFIVGLTGVALLSSLISGVLAHPRIFRDAFHVRLGGSKRLQEADLHNRLGVWALPFHLVVSLTGALLGLTTLIVGVLGIALFQGEVDKVYELFLPAEPKEDARPAPIIDLVPMFADLGVRVPQGHIDLVMLEHPTETGGAAMFIVEQDSGRLSNTDTFAYGRTGVPYYEKRAADNNLGESILGSLGKLHFGWFGGGVIKIAYGLLGLGLTYLCASGVTIWLARRRDKRNPAPGWERLWTAVLWGQPAGLSLAGLLAAGGGRAVPVGVLIAVWGLATLAALAAAARVPSHVLARILRLVMGIALIGSGALHLLFRGGSDPVALTVDLVLLAGGAAFLWQTLCAWRRAVMGSA